MVLILRNISSNKYQQANQVQQKQYSAKKKEKKNTNKRKIDAFCHCN